MKWKYLSSLCELFSFFPDDSNNSFTIFYCSLQVSKNDNGILIKWTEMKCVFFPTTNDAFLCSHNSPNIRTQTSDIEGQLGGKKGERIKERSNHINPHTSIKA